MNKIVKVTNDQMIKILKTLVDSAEKGNAGLVAISTHLAKNIIEQLEKK